jgi:hypothetical protein
MHPPLDVPSAPSRSSTDSSAIPRSTIASFKAAVFAPGSPDASPGSGNGSPSVCSMDYLGIRIARTGRPAVEMRMWRPARALSGTSLSWCSRGRARRGPRGEGAKRPIAGWRARSREQGRIG